MIKGVLFDIDDTLYSHTVHKVPKLTLKLLKKLREKGIKIGICTSRFIAEMATFSDVLEDYVDCKIMGTGAVTQVKNKYFKIYTIDNDLVREYVSYFKKHNISYAYSDIAGNTFFWGDFEMFKERKLFSLADGKVMFKEWEEEDEISNIYYYFASDEDEDAIHAINPDAYISKWGKCGNICATYIDKSFGVLKFCEQYGFTTDEVVACGDGGNDGEMLEMAGIGIAVYNAKEKTKAMADYVCDKPIEDGGLYEQFVKLGIIEDDHYAPEAFFFDNDSTLFDHNIHAVRKSTLNAITQLKNKGYKLVMNTSRSYDELREIDKSFLEMFDAICCVSGGYMRIGNEIKTQAIKDETLKKLLKCMNRNGLTYRLATVDGGGFLNHNDKDKEDLFMRLYDMVPPIKKYEGEEVCHVLFYADDEKYEEVKSQLDDEVCVRLKIAGEISPSNMDKSKALIKVCEYLNIDIANSVAMGDGNNDLTMIKMAGLGIAMGNGNRSLKDEADYVTDDISQEGLYNALKHFGFVD